MFKILSQERMKVFYFILFTNAWLLTKLSVTEELKLSVLNSENSVCPVSWGIYMIEHWQIILKICHFKVVYLVAKPLIWSEAEGDLVGIETSN